MPEDRTRMQQEMSYLSDERKEKIIARLFEIDRYKVNLPKTETENGLQALETCLKWRLPFEAIAILLDSLQLQSGGKGLDAKLLNREINGSTAAHNLLDLDQSSVKQFEDEQIKRATRHNRLRQLFYTAYSDSNLVLLLLAKHIARMEGLNSLEYQQARLLCEENEVVFLPLMEMLGVWDLRRKYGDMSLKLLNPHKIWDKMTSAKAAMKPRLEQYEKEICALLIPEFQKASIPAEILYHVSSNASTYRSFTHGIPLNELTSQLKVDIRVDTEEECYQVLRLIHKNWPPLVGHTLNGGYFRDLIAFPKFNGYRALITTIGYKRGDKKETQIPIEFRIFTYEMELCNVMGIIYTQYQRTPTVSIKNTWWDDLKLLDFIRSHPLNTTDAPEIYIFSPVGRVYRHLKLNSTPIDYAYRVHSEVGHHCKRIWVNGEPTSYQHKLNSGDLVEIEVDANYPGPDERWLAVVKTSTARSHIRRALRQHAPHKGWQIIEKILKQEQRNYQLEGEFTDKEIQEYIAQVARKYGYADPEALYTDIATPENTDKAIHHVTVSPNRIVDRLIAQKLASQIVPKDGAPLGVPANRIRFAHCKEGGHDLHVTPGCAIVGKIIAPNTTHAQFVVYRKDCTNAPASDEAIALEWLGNRRPGEPVKIAIEAVDRPFLLQQILSGIYKLYDQKAYLLNADADVNVERKAEVHLTVEAPDYPVINLLMQEMEALKNIGVIDSFNITALNPLEKMRLREPYQLYNPYTMGPILDQRVFKGRENEINQVVSTFKGEQNVIVIYGVNRIGKTSLLRHIQTYVAEAHNFIPVLVDLQSLVEQNEEQFWLEIAKQINLAMQKHCQGKKGRFHAYNRRVKENLFESFLKWLIEIRTTFPLRKLLIMIDELNLLDEVWKDKSEAKLVIYRLKHIAENYRDISFILSMQEALYRQAQTNEETIISWPLLRAGTPIRLDYMDRPAAERLIRDPMGQMIQVDEDAVSQIIEMTACHPYLLHNAMHRIVNLINLGQSKVITCDSVQLIRTGMLTEGEHIFQSLNVECWPPREQVIKELAYLSGLESLPVSSPEIRLQLRRDHAGDDLIDNVNNCLDSLTEARILNKQTSIGETRYTVRIPLFNQWLIESRTD